MHTTPSGILLSLISTSIGVVGALLGVSWLGAAPRKIVPVSGALLAAIAVLGVYPELAAHHGWITGAAMLAGGVAGLWLFGRYVHPVCPSCSHTHDHEHCARMLHGFTGPLLIAASLHAFLDGLGISASQQEASTGLAAMVVLGVTVHKIPEGIALAVMLRASVGSRLAALALAFVAELFTLFGAIFEAAITARLGAAWVSYALALAGGGFLYLGFHAVHGQWRRYFETAHAAARVQ